MMSNGKTGDTGEDTGDGSGGGKGMLGSLAESVKSSSAVQALGDQAKGYLQAKGTDMVGSLTGRLEDAGNNGGLFTKSSKGDKDEESSEDQDSSEGKEKGGLLSGAKDKIKSMFGGGKSKGGGGSQKVMHIIEDCDVGVPVSVAYDQWTQFEEFSSFTKGVESVDMKDEIESTWKFKVFKSRRTNTATISEQIPDHRIAWNTEGAKGTCKGTVTFHPLGENLTKVLLVLEYYPAGFFEKTGNLWRAVGRRARLDLKRYRDFVTISGEATGSWRGEIRDSEVVKQPEDVEAEEQQTDDDAAADDDENAYSDEESYDEDEYGEDSEPEDEDTDYDEQDYDETDDEEPDEEEEADADDQDYDEAEPDEDEIDEDESEEDEDEEEPAPRRSRRGMARSGR
jgi:uncharacterized membrane protein